MHRRRSQHRPQTRLKKKLPRVEAHVIDRTDLDLYDKVVSLEYVKHIRPSAKFNGIEDLVAAINRDVAMCRIILGVVS